MRALWLLILSLFLSGPAFAQAKVRTGEHEGFTRVVIDIPAVSEWKIGKISDGYMVTIDGVFGYDLRAFFRRIQKDRISAVRTDPNTNALVILSDCDCSADAFLFGRNKLVIDILDGADSGNSRFNQDVKLAVQKIPFMPDFPVTSDRTEGTFIPSIELGSNRLQSLENEIAMGIARATSQGLLDAPETLAPTIGTQREIVPNDDPINIAGILAHTSMDTPSSVDQSRSDSVRANCLPNSLFSVHDWGDARSFSIQVAEKRNKLSGEFDKIDATALVELARLYVFFGFGTEANVTIGMDGLKSQERSILSSLAHTLDEQPLTSDVLEGQQHCRGSVAFWSFVSSTAAGPAPLIDSNAILRTFKSLPTHLQILMGPRLSRKFLDHGDVERAELALFTAGDQGANSSELLAAQAQVVSEIDGPQEASNTLAASLESDTRMSPQALIQYFDLNAESGEAPADESLELAEVFRFELRDTEIVKIVVERQVLALLRALEFEKATKIFKEEFGTSETERAKNLWSEVIAAITSHATDGVFLELAFRNDFGSAGIPIKSLAAARLSDLGFRNRAEDLFKTTGFGLTDVRDGTAEGSIVTTLESSIVSEITGPLNPSNVPAQPEEVAIIKETLEVGRRLVEQSAETRDRIARVLSPIAPSE